MHFKFYQCYWSHQILPTIWEGDFPVDKTKENKWRYIPFLFNYSVKNNYNYYQLGLLLMLLNSAACCWTQQPASCCCSTPYVEIRVENNNRALKNFKSLLLFSTQNSYMIGRRVTQKKWVVKRREKKIIELGILKQKFGKVLENFWRSWKNSAYL